MIETIKLNVGGHHCEIHSTLLEICPNSVLAQAISEQCKENHQNEVFIDRDGTTFRYVLNYLRDGHVTIPITESREALMKEFDYYGIVAHHEDIHAVSSPSATAMTGAKMISPKTTGTPTTGTTTKATPGANICSCICSVGHCISSECDHCIRVHHPTCCCRCDCGGRTCCHGRGHHAMHMHGAQTGCKCVGICRDSCRCKRFQSGCTSDCGCGCA